MGSSQLNQKKGAKLEELSYLSRSKWAIPLYPQICGKKSSHTDSKVTETGGGVTPPPPQPLTDIFAINV